MKKFLSIAIILCYIFSSIAPAFATDGLQYGTTDNNWVAGTTINTDTAKISNETVLRGDLTLCGYN